MKPAFTSKKFEFILDGQNALIINCIPCDRDAKVQYLGLAGTQPRFSLYCRQCGSSTTIEIFNPLASDGFHELPKSKLG